MSVEVSPEMVGLEQASVELDRMMAADAAAPKPSQEPGKTDQSATAAPAATEADRAAQTAKTDAKPKEISTANDKKAADTLATAGPDGLSPKDPKADPKAAASEAGKTLSRFAKTQQRKEKSWEELNREKAELKAERDKLTRERDEFAQARQKQESQYSPEQYEEAAKKFESEGKFDLADLAKSRAADLRKNPPPTEQQRQSQQQQQAQYQQELREWWGKAAIDYPEVAKEGTPVNVALRTFLQNEPLAIQTPKLTYYAARLVTSEAAAARVPGMEKELGALRAQVKELELLTASSPPGVPGKQAPAESQGESLEALEDMAKSMGPLR